jgi:outer membrane protein OmpA-like peptidoglycan-associated protein
MARINRKWAGITAFFIALMVPGTAWPDFADHGLYLGAYGGYNDKPGDWRLGASSGVFFACAPLNPASSALAGLRLGFHFTPQLIGEIAGGYLPLHSEIKVTGQTGGRNTVLQGDLDLYYQLLRGDFSPFIGIGVSRFQCQAGGDLGFDYEPSAHASIGIRGLIAPFIALRAEIRDYAVENYSASGVGQLLQVTGGIDFYLYGGRKKAEKPVVVVPPAPDLIAPANGDSMQSLAPVLRWTAAAGATSYIVQVATDPTFAAPLFSRADSATLLSSLTGLSNATTYYWRASSSAAAGISGWSAVWSFTTAKPVKTEPVPPPAPTLVSPADGATMQSLSPVLSWNASSGATSYTVQVSTEPGFIMPLLNQTDRATALPSLTGLSNATTYYWRAMASAEANSSWSAVWSFTTMPAAVEKFTGTIRGIHFQSSSAIILRSSYPTLDSAVAIFKRYKSLQIRIDGHADSTWTPEFNQKLSESRAESVKAYLVAKGIEESRITAAGHGSTMPVESNDTPAGRAANRRIEFSVVNL